MLKRVILVYCALMLAAVATAGAVEKVRPAAMAGSWYPGDADQLSAYVDNLLKGGSHTGDKQGPVRAIISPHAGYEYSGAVAADGYRLVRGQSYKRVLLLGPSHHGRFHGLSIADVTHYETPLGRIPLDMNAVEQLRTSGLVTANTAADREEHSLEMQLPFLQRALKPGWQLVPILVGQLAPEDYATAAELLRPLLDDDTLVVVSSDFTHYGPRYHYQPFPLDNDTAARLKALDDGSLNTILHRNAQGFLDYQARTGDTICGYQPIALLLKLLPADSKGELVSYDTSGKLTGDYENSVSYMSIVFRESENDAATVKQPEAGELPVEDMQLLHKLASAAVEIAASPQDEAAMQRLQALQQNIPQELEVPSAAFVTLFKAGHVRGCIGTTTPTAPLYHAIASIGYMAARKDGRFTPVQPEELEGLDVEISVLSNPVSVNSYKDFVLGKEGVILEKDGHNAVFLPEVPTEYNWNREQMLNRLARKAGLPVDAWKEGASFKIFHTQTYSAPFTVTDH
jgi:AmmeMemoRadiSam system protein B/AmmeMemoRadiSam system protein A